MPLNNDQTCVVASSSPQEEMSSLGPGGASKPPRRPSTLMLVCLRIIKSVISFSLFLSQTPPKDSQATYLQRFVLLPGVATTKQDTGSKDAERCLPSAACSDLPLTRLARLLSKNSLRWSPTKLLRGNIVRLGWASTWSASWLWRWPRFGAASPSCLGEGSHQAGRAALF